MEDDMYMSGTFVNKEGDIFIVANNIVDNLPFNYLLFHLKNKPRSRNYYKEEQIQI